MGDLTWFSKLDVLTNSNRNLMLSNTSCNYIFEKPINSYGLGYVHLFNTWLSYAPISISFFVNFACLIRNFVSVIFIYIGLNFQNLKSYYSVYFHLENIWCHFPKGRTSDFVVVWEMVITTFIKCIMMHMIP